MKEFDGLTSRGRAIYLAARFGRKAEMADVATRLETAGFAVVSQWVRIDDLPYTPAAVMDVADLNRADMLLSFTELPDAPDKGTGGRHVELGLALTLGKRCVLIGPREHVFHYLPQITVFDTLEDFLTASFGRA